METQPGIHTERADASPKVTTQPEETAAGGKNDANIKLQMNLDNSIKGVISNNAVNDMKTETNEPSGAPNGKENESTKKSQPVIMDSVSQTIQDVASGILAPDPCAPLRLKEEQEKLQQLQYQKANQSSVTQERNSSTHSRFQNNVSQLHTPPGGFNVSRTDPYQFPSHVPVPTQSFSSQQFSQGRLPPNHPSMNIASQLSDSANQNDTRKPSLPGNSQNPLSHQTLPGNSNVNSSLAQNQTSGAIDNFHSSSTAGHNMPSSASIHSVPSIRPQSHELPKSKGVGRRPPRPQTQGAEPQVQNPYMQGIPRRMPPMFDPRFMQMVRSMTDPRFMPDPRMIPPQMMPHFIRMQQMAKQHMASQAQQHQPPQAHVSQPQGHGEVSHYQGAPQPAHSAHAQHLEIAGHQQRLSVPNTQPSQEAGLTTLSEFPHSVTAQQQTYPVASHVASGKTTVSVSNSATPPILSHSEQQRTDSINSASVQTFQQTSTSSASTQQVANQLDQSMPISSQPLALNSSINTLSISTSVTQSTIPVSASSLELANSQVNQVSLASSLATQPDRPSSKHSMENPPSNHSVERPSSVSSTSSIHDSHKLVGHITSHSNDTPHQVGSETIGGPQSCTTPVTSAGNSISQPSVTSSVSVGGHGVVSVSSFAVSSSQCVQMSTCTTQTPYGVEEDGTEKTASQTKLVPALSQHEQPSPLPISVNQVPPATGTTSSMLPSTSVTTVAATTGMPSQPRMPSTTGQHSLPTHGPPQFPPSSMTGGLVRTPFGMLPHHPPGISQAGGLPPYGGMRPFPVPHSQMPANMPPGLALPPNMRMPHGFPPGFSMPPMQRMPGAMGSMQSAMASMAQQAQQMTAEMAVSSHDQTAGRLPSPVSSAGGPRMSQSTSAPTSQQLENLFRMSMGMRPSMAQQHGMRPPPGVRLPTNQGQQLSRMPGQMMPGMIPPTPTSEASRMMSPNQQGKDPTGTQPDGARKLVGPPSLPSPAASSTPSPKVLAPTPPLKMDQPGVMDPVAMAELIRNTEVKQEQLEGGENKELTQEEIDQNALLKALLKSSKGGGAGQMQRQLSTMSEVNPCKQDSEDAPMLTPDQQRQLDLIEKMPLVTETDWDLKTQEERNHIIEMRKQAYEQKRKEFEQLRKMKRKSPGEPRKRKKKEKVEGEGQVMANAGDPTAVPTQPKKRQRKTKKQTQGGSEEDLEAKADDFLQKLRALPTVALQEPKVGDFFNVSPIPGCPSVVTGDSALKGSFGKAYLEDVADFYGNTLLKGLPPLGSLVGLPRDESRRKYLGVRSVESSSEHHGYQLAPENIPHVGSKSGTVSKPMQSFKSPLIDMGDKPVMPSLPPSPRIEPRLDPVLRGDESPCTIVSSSSPEHDFGDGEEEDYPMLKPIDPAQSTSNDRSSPLVPEYHQPNPVRLDSLKIKEDLEEFKKENIDSSVKSVSQELVEKKIAKLDSSISEKENMKGKIPSLSSLTQPFRDANLNQDISVTLTLSANAAEDIGGVLSQIADLLKIAVPPSYEISGSPSPEMYKMNMKHKEEPVNIHSLIKSKAKFCRHCDMVVFDSGYRKKRSEIPFLVKDDYSFKDFDDDEVTFCSEKCYSQFASIYQMIHKPPPQEFREDFSSFPNRTFAHSMGVAKPSSSMFNLMSPASNDSLLPTTPTKSDMSLTPTPSTPTSGGTLTPVQPSPPIRQRSEEKMAKKHKRTSSMDVQPPKAIVKKWKDRRYKKWDPSFTQTLETAPGVPESEIENIWKAHQAVIVPKPTPKDDRVCAFCQIIGDGETDGPGRLLNMDINKWAHLNCALWSSEVYETLNGALMNVDGAYTRGQSIDCALCKTKGATVGCFNMRCPKYYHLGCAKNAGCMFFQDKTILCPVHAPKQDAENVLESLVVYRRVYINRNEDKQVANMVHGQEDGNHTLRVGSLILHSVGQLLPHQIQTGKFHTRDYIYPVGFKSSRLYWSMKRLYKRCRYNCSITEREGRPWFNICVVEPGCEDVIFEDNSPRTVWNKILEPLDKLRRAADLVKIFPYFITGEELFGLTEPSVVRVIESLPGTDLLTNYLFKFSRSLRIEMPLTINPTGCARTEPKLRTHFRKPHTLQSSNTSSRSLPSTVTGFTGDMNSPYMKQFVHSKSQQYRRLKTEWRNIVYLGRSRIQGLGLYAARDLEKHTMVIEYIGHLIRNEVANRKEISYEEQNRGVYMFRIDNETVVDATMAGGPARYINHSCNPNCVAEVVPFDKESKIIIITNRRIPRGEELTYDYKFDFEDDQHKIPCCCGAPKCRKWMN